MKLWLGFMVNTHMVWNVDGEFGKVIVLFVMRMVELYATWIMLWHKSHYWFLIWWWFRYMGWLMVNEELVGMYWWVNELWVEATCIYYTPPLLLSLATTLIGLLFNLVAVVMLRNFGREEPICLEVVHPLSSLFFVGWDFPFPTSVSFI